jgi:hypothetical protein
MSELAVLTAQAPAYRRQSKFTPANIRQIVNLVERGKSKEEIAEIIGVTPATLQVTCSKLGISLRRPASDAPSTLSRLRRPDPQNVKTPDCTEPIRETPPAEDRKAQAPAMSEAARPAEDQAVVRLHPEPAATHNPGSDGVTLAIRYKGDARTVDLPLDRNLLGLLALEAQFRSMSICDLIGRIFLSVTKNDLFQTVLDKA